MARRPKQTELPGYEQEKINDVKVKEGKESVNVKIKQASKGSGDPGSSVAE